MKTPALIPTNFESATLFQAAARMEVPVGRPVVKPASAITEQTFANLRVEAEASQMAPSKASRRGAITQMLVSFDAVRLSVFSHTLERLRRPA